MRKNLIELYEKFDDWCKELIWLEFSTFEIETNNLTSLIICLVLVFIVKICLM